MNASSFTFVQPLERRCLFSGCARIDGIGVMGDSYSDEYQFYAPDRATARNWVEQLDEDSNARFGAFATIDPPGPRNAGFAFNWAVSGASSGDLIAGGQHAGVVAQAAGGAVDLVTLFVGGNDFRNVFGILATQGPAAAQAALLATVPTAVANIHAAAATVLAPEVLASNPDLHLILTTIPNPSYLPEVRAAMQATPQIQPFVAAVDQAVEALNHQIRAIATSLGSRAAVADFDGLIDGVFAARRFKVGHVTINVHAINNPTNDPTHLVLADRIHPGTIGQGLLANLYVKTANRAFGTRLKKLSTRDLLENAGLTNGLAHVAQPSGRSPFAASPPIASQRWDDLLGTECNAPAGDWPTGWST